MLKHEDGSKGDKTEFPEGEEGGTNGSLVDTTHHNGMQEVLIDHVRAHNPGLVEQAHEEQRIRDHVIEAQNPGALIANGLVTLAD